MLGPTRISGIDRERMGQAAKHESQVRQTERREKSVATASFTVREGWTETTTCLGT